jgi:hypothetical protein
MTVNQSGPFPEALANPPQAAQRDELARALGALVINFSALEESLHDGILTLARPDQSDERTMVVVNVLTAGLQFKTLTEKVRGSVRRARNGTCVSRRSP